MACIPYSVLQKHKNFYNLCILFIISTFQCPKTYKNEATKAFDFIAILS